MIVFIRRSSAVLLVCIFVLSFALLALGESAKKAPQAVRERCVLLDAGHGAPDGGCVGADGTQEAALNLAVCLLLRSELEARGYRVLMTRTDENGIHDSGESVQEKKRSDMKNRRKLRDTAPAALFVSIHMNSFPEAKYSGAQVVYDCENPAALTAAQCIQTALRTSLNPDNKRTPMAAPSSLYLLQKPKLPSVLVECGFLSNPEECAKLKTEAYQRRVAEAVAEGIAAYTAQQRDN